MRHKFIKKLLLSVFTISYLNAMEVDDWGDTELPTDEGLILQEKIYRDRVKADFNNCVEAIRPDLSHVRRREAKVIYQNFKDNPQSLFEFSYEGHRIIGKKHLSDKVVFKDLPGVFCSEIKSPMILGLMERAQMTQNGIFVFYYPFVASEKAYIFDFLRHNRLTDVYYPYIQLLSDKKLEKTTPPSGWKYDPERGKALAYGEDHIRNHTIEFLKEFQDLEGKIIYDPACSTGDFLKNIKDHFPKVYTIGQDLSESMVEEARKKVDKSLVGDALNSSLEESSVDFIFLRFLNAEVLTTEQAHRIFYQIIKKCKIGGHVILLGHTPVLIPLPLMQKLGLKVIQSIGFNEHNNSIFQYYIVQKEKADCSIFEDILKETIEY